MTTKLEAMVGYLAGRGGDDRFLDELADPNSEASRFLEATQARSKALLEGPSRSGPLESDRPIRSKSWVPWVVLAVVALIATGLVAWLIDVRLRRLEALAVLSKAESEATARKIETTLARLLEIRPEPPSLVPVEKAIGQVEAGLSKLERRIESLGPRPEPAKVDPIFAEIRDGLVLLRRELSADEKTKVRQIEEMQASIHELGRVLRLLLNRVQPPAPTTDPPTAFPPSPPNRDRGPGRSS